MNKPYRNRTMTQRLIYITGECPEKPIVYALHGEQGDMLIDTGNEAMVHQLDDWIKETNLNVRWAFLTHGHFDHTWNCRFLKEKYGTQIILHEKDRELLALGEIRRLYASKYCNEAITEESNAISDMYAPYAPFCKVDYYINNEDTGFLRTLGFDADIVMLPGHTRGSVGVMQGKVLYCGDACASINGQYFTALFGEEPESIFPSEEKIFEMDPMIIAPGHGKIIINELHSGFNKRR